MITATRRSVLALVIALGAVPAAAQPPAPSPVDEGRTELVALAGYTTDGGDLTIGGGIQRTFRPRFLLAIDGAYLTGGERLALQDADVASHAIALDVNGHYLFPREWSDRTSPYVLAGLGYVRVGTHVRAPAELRRTTHSVGVTLGGGFRWELTGHWTMRPEIRVLFADFSHIRATWGFLYAVRR